MAWVNKVRFSIFNWQEVVMTSFVAGIFQSLLYADFIYYFLVSTQTQHCIKFPVWCVYNSILYVLIRISFKMYHSSLLNAVGPFFGELNTAKGSISDSVKPIFVSFWEFAWCHKSWTWKGFEFFLIVVSCSLSFPVELVFANDDELVLLLFLVLASQNNFNTLFAAFAFKYRLWFSK